MTISPSRQGCCLEWVSWASPTPPPGPSPRPLREPSAQPAVALVTLARTSSLRVISLLDHEPWKVRVTSTHSPSESPGFESYVMASKCPSKPVSASVKWGYRTVRPPCGYDEDQEQQQLALRSSSGYQAAV